MKFSLGNLQAEACLGDKQKLLIEVAILLLEIFNFKKIFTTFFFDRLEYNSTNALWIHKKINIDDKLLIMSPAIINRIISYIN